MQLKFMRLDYSNLSVIFETADHMAGGGRLHCGRQSITRREGLFSKRCAMNR